MVKDASLPSVKVKAIIKSGHACSSRVWRNNFDATTVGEYKGGF